MNWYPNWIQVTKNLKGISGIATAIGLFSGQIATVPGVPAWLGAVGLVAHGIFTAANALVDSLSKAGLADKGPK